MCSVIPKKPIRKSAKTFRIPVGSLGSGKTIIYSRKVFIMIYNGSYFFLSILVFV